MKTKLLRIKALNNSTLLPKDDFWVARQFIQASIDYLHSIHDIRKHYEDRENTDSN